MQHKLGPLCSSSKALFARLSIARLFSLTWLCICHSSSSLHDFRLVTRYFIYAAVDVMDNFSWGLRGELQAMSMSPSTSLCALVTLKTCGPSCKADSIRAIVLMMMIFYCSYTSSVI